MPRQLPIPGTEPPRNAGIEELVCEIAEHEAECSRRSKLITQLKLTLAQRMLDAKLPSYDFIDNDGNTYTTGLDLPDLPKVKIRFIGKRDE